VARGQKADSKQNVKKNKRASTRNTAAKVALPQGIEIKPCEYGRGVFATRAFSADVLIGEVQGEVITDADYGSQNCMDLGDYGVLEPAPPFQYLNHSCEPNCELQWELDRKRPRVYVQSTRPIAIGEQLTLDYAWPADEAIPCQCQSAGCRGWVVAEDERHLLPNVVGV
jgi:hypothetical protein